MKYFEIMKKPQINMAPRLKNWYGSFDVRDIKLDSFYKLPERQLLLLDMTEKEIFTDVITSPFLLISQKVMDVIKMYGDLCFYRQFFLLDAGSTNAENYYLPVFDESKCIQLNDKEFEAGKCNRKLFEEETALNVNKNIFWIHDSLTRHTIISLDFAESMLRRGVTGVELKEVILTKKE
ncbi:hypothetical protein [Lacrimispora brassicae]